MEETNFSGEDLEDTGAIEDVWTTKANEKRFQSNKCNEDFEACGEGESF